MVICHCERVTERRVARALNSGCATVSDLSQATGAGRGCGCCVPSLKRVIEQHFGRSTGQEHPHEAA
ncbi:MAG: (2Fe-2S)-binding protein [Candidatus Nanopelagicales bacterium]